MFKVEDFQNYGKEHFESVQNGLHAIATAYGDYSKKSSRTPSRLSRSSRA